jgi:N-acetylglutamate synthase-like GNAT family acetyltransferase
MDLLNKINTEELKISERLLRIFKFAEKEAETTDSIIHPVHLLLGTLLERSGVCAELFLQFPTLFDILKDRVNKITFDKSELGMKHSPFKKNISLSTKQVLEIAENRMKRFTQVYINEGILIKAIFDLNETMTKSIMNGIDILPILEIISSPRDMIVPLRNYSPPEFAPSEITFRKAILEDAGFLKNFVEKEFGNGWLESIENGFQEENIPIYIALLNDQIIGFACFDVVRRKKGLFGPMGTSILNRTQGIGFTLLHYCLREMQKIGYEYAIIGEAGPLEFYEKSCNAVVIPKM